MSGETAAAPALPLDIILSHVKLFWFSGLAQEITVLLIDDCSAHVSDDVTRIRTEARVRGITFAPHTTQVFHVFVLTLFGVPM
jgi:hypothetical protein